MALFKRSGKKPPQPEQTAVQVSLNPGRMAAVYLQLYRWVFSVSLDYDSYQIESGSGEFAGRNIPIRGYYSRLIGLLGQHVLEIQRETFDKTFSPQGLRAALSEGYTAVTELFYLRTSELQQTAPEGQPAQEETAEQPAVEPAEESYDWFEFRAECFPTQGERKAQFLLYVRPVAGEKDTGRLPAPKETPVREDGSYDWGGIRSERLLNSDKIIYYEYDIQNDTMHIHRLRGDKRVDRVEKNYLATLDARGDWMVHHDSVKRLRQLFRDGAQGVSGDTELLYRKDGMQGANFIYYHIVCRPLEERDTPTWLFGSLEDVDAKVRAREQARELMVQMETMLGNLYTNMFQIDLNRGVIYHIVHDENGFSREKDPLKLETYVQRHIKSGVIAPESAKEYRNWLQPGYLQRKTLKGSYEFEARLRLLGAPEYSWYSETITAVAGRPGIYLRLRRDINDVWQMRQKQYEMTEMVRFAEFSSSVLDTMASLVEFRNTENGLHVARVRELTRILLTDIATRSPQYEVTQKTIDLYTQAATIHDIGKVTIPDAVLNKPGRYTPEEREIMKTHTTTGARIVDRLHMPGMGDLQACCRDVVLHHHERYDGKGYPEGLAGDQISMGVQAVSLADVYDALVSVRCYKEAMSFEEALDMILTGQCGTFNPHVLESMKAVEPAMRALYQDHEKISELEQAAAQALLEEHTITEETANA